MVEFLCFCASVVGAVSLWRWFVRWTTGTHGWKLPLARLGALPVTFMGWMLCLGVLLAIFAPSTDKASASGKAAEPAAQAAPKPAPVPPTPPAPKVFDMTPQQLMANVNEVLHTHTTGKLERGDKLDTYSASAGHGLHFIAGVDKETGKVVNLVVLGPPAAGAALTAQAQRAGEIVGAVMPLGYVATAAHQVEEMAKEHEAFGNAPYRSLDAITLAYSIDSTVGMMVGADHEPRAPVAKLEGSPESFLYPQCKQAVTDRLKSPGSADFPWGADRVVSNPNDPTSFVVFGHVDAQNGFGALLRADWACQIAYKGGDHYDPSSWSVFDVALQER